MAEIIKLSVAQIEREINDKAFYGGQRKKDRVDLGLSPSTIIIEINSEEILDGKVDDT